MRYAWLAGKSSRRAAHETVHTFHSDDAHDRGHTLSAMVILVRATLYVTSIESPLPRAGAIPRGNFARCRAAARHGMLATHAAVLIFAPKSDKPEGGPLG